MVLLAWLTFKPIPSGPARHTNSCKLIDEDIGAAGRAGTSELLATCGTLSIDPDMP